MVRISCGLPFAIRHVTLAADGQEQGVNAGGVDGVDGLEAGKFDGHHGSRQFVNEFAEGGVFLGRPADNGEGPDRAPRGDRRYRRSAREIRAPGCNIPGGRRTGLRAGSGLD